MSAENKIEKELGQMQARRNAIWNDLKTHGHTLSAPSQVSLIGEIASLDSRIQEMKRELEDMGWQEFIQAAWEGGDDSKF
jgi:chromosome condensin MukBEF ATPase and DNA-binding subunit MukB